MSNLIHKIGHKIINNIDVIYKGYAFFSHNKLMRKTRESKKNKDIEECSDFKEVCNEAKTHGATIYGQEIIDRFNAKADHAILMVSHELSLTGAPIALFHFAMVLRDLGYPVIVLSAEDGKQLAEYSCTKNIPVIADPLVFTTDFVPKIRKLFQSIIVNTIFSAPAINMLSGTDTRVIWWIHEANDCYGGRSAKEMPFSVSENIQILVPGEYARKQLIRRYPNYHAESFVYGIPELQKENGIITKPCLKSEKYKKVYSSIGTWIARKGTDILADAIDRIPKAVREGSLFVFVGKRYESDITEKVLKLKEKYPENIMLLHEIDYQSMYSIYSQTDFLIVSSRDDPLPMVAAEGMSVRCPCICSENTGSADFILQYHTGVVYGDNSPAKLAEKIAETYFMEPDAYQAMADHSRRLYEQVFSEEALRNRIISNHIIN